MKYTGELRIPVVLEIDGDLDPREAWGHLIAQVAESNAPSLLVTKAITVDGGVMVSLGQDGSTWDAGFLPDDGGL